MSIAATGLVSFFTWLGLSAACFIIAVVAGYCADSRGSRYGARLGVMLALLVLWWMLVPAAGRAFAGNHADPRDADRRARWQAKELGRVYGAHTIWVWVFIAVFHDRKQKAHE